MMPKFETNLNEENISFTDKATQYVLIELFRNVFLEKIMVEIRFPIRPITTVTAIVVLIANVNEAVDIFLILY